MARQFQHVEMSGQIGLAIGFRVINRVAHAGLCRQMHDLGDRDVRGGAAQGSTVGNIAFHKTKRIVVRFQRIKPPLLQRGGIIAVQIVQTDNPFTTLQQALRHVKADKAGHAGHKICHMRSKLFQGIVSRGPAYITQRANSGNAGRR